MQSSKRFPIWPQLAVIVALAMASELVRGLALFLEPGLIVVNGQTISKFSYLMQHLAGLARGSAMLGVPFGILAWLTFCLAFPGKKWWRDLAIVFMLVAACNALVTPMDGRLPPLIAFLSPYIVFAIGVVLCRNLGHLRSQGGSLVPPDLANQSADLQTDLACANCGYNLRGLAVSTQCPECGFQVGQTIRMLLFRPRTRSFWKFFPITLGFLLALFLAYLQLIDLALRFRPQYPLKEGLWGNKWLFLVLYESLVLYAVTAIVTWPLFWLALRRKRLTPSLIFLFAAVMLSCVFALSIENLPVAPLLTLLVGLGICAWSGWFDQRPKIRAISS